MDCAAHAVINAAKGLGIEVCYEDAFKAAKVQPNGGSTYDGARWLADTFRLEMKSYPHSDDLVWTPHTDDPRRRTAYPETNAPHILPEYLRLLSEGWVGITQHLWGATGNDHAVSLLPSTMEGRFDVMCSLRGRYTVGAEFFKSERGYLQAAFGTYWLHQKGART